MSRINNFSTLKYDKFLTLREEFELSDQVCMYHRGVHERCTPRCGERSVAAAPLCGEPVACAPAARDGSSKSSSWSDQHPGSARPSPVVGRLPSMWSRCSSPRKDKIPPVLSPSCRILHISQFTSIFESKCLINVIVQRKQGVILYGLVFLYSQNRVKIMVCSN